MALSFLSYTSTPHISQSRQSSENDKYAPLYGVWLMDLALHLGWYRPRSPRRWPDIFEDSDFCAMTGLDVDSVEEPERITAGHCLKLLTSHRAKLAKKKLPQSLTLFKNLRILAGMVNLTDADPALPTFSTRLSIFS